MLGGLRSQASDAFGLHPPSQLVLGYHWLAFLNQICKNCYFEKVSSSLLTTVEYKIDYISKTENRTNLIQILIAQIKDLNEVCVKFDVPIFYTFRK